MLESSLELLNAAIDEACLRKNAGEDLFHKGRLSRVLAAKLETVLSSSLEGLKYKLETDCKLNRVYKVNQISQPATELCKTILRNEHRIVLKSLTSTGPAYCQDWRFPAPFNKNASTAVVAISWSEEAADAYMESISSSQGASQNNVTEGLTPDGS